LRVGALISYKSFYRVNTLNIALREIRKIVIIYIVVFYNAKYPKQDIRYIPVPKYVLYLCNLAYADSFKIYKDGFRNPETVFREGGVYELVIAIL